MKKIVALLLALMMLLSLAACAKEEAPADEPADDAVDAPADEPADSDDAADSENTWKVAMINLTDGSEDCYLCVKTFADTVQTDEFAKRVGHEVEAIMLDSQMDLEKQQNLVEQLIMQDVDQIFLIGVDTDGNTTAVEACNEAGIPIFMVATTASGGDYTFVGWDEYDFGVFQGEWAAENLPENCKICYADGTSGRETFEKREAGFKDVIAEKRPDCEIISTQAAEGTTAEETMQITEDWITQYGDDIGCIVTPSPNMGQGAVEALKASDMLDDVIVLSCVSAGSWDAELVRDGSFDYGIVIGFDVLGELCADIAARCYLGEDIAESESIQFFDATPETIGNYYPAA